MSTIGGPRRAEEHDPDERLLHELQGVITQADPVPAHVLDAARAVFGMRDLDEELAALVADSASGLGGLALVRAELVTRLLSFEAEDGVGVELELTTTGGTLDAQGQVVGDLQGDVVLEHAGGVQHVTADDLGRFEVRGLPSGRLRLRWRSAAGRRTTTVWVDV
jgi:hypothetical protein